MAILNINIDSEFTQSGSEGALWLLNDREPPQDDKQKHHFVSIVEYDDETGELIGVYQTQENSTLHQLAKANPKKFRILSEPLKTDFSSSPFHNPLAIQNSNFPSGNLTVGMGDSGDIAQIKRKLEEAIAKIREFIIDKLQGYFPEMTDEDGITWITLPYGTTQFAGAWGITS